MVPLRMNFGISKYLARRGIYIARTSDGSDLLGRLRPRITEHQLERFGSQDGDGGYLVPKVAGELQGVLSAGVADNVDFELELASTFGLKVDLLDGSIDHLPMQHPNFRFRKNFLGIRQAPGFISLKSWMDLSGLKGRNLMLKVDIEGFEYESILTAEDSLLDQFKVMIFELHSLEQISTKLGNAFVSAFVDKVTKNHTVVHAHANNVGGLWKFPSFEVPAGIEITLLRNDSFENLGGFAAVPHPLDRDCDSSRKTVRLTWNER